MRVRRDRLPALRPARAARDRHHGHLRRQLLVLPALGLPEGRDAAVRLRARQPLVCRSIVHRRYRARHPDLLYARFTCRVLHDFGLVDFEEPFTNLFNQGMITRLAEASGRVEKMSKSRGNTVSPDALIEQMGADTERVYTLFLGPPEDEVEWNDEAVAGAYRFLKRLWRAAAALPEAPPIAPADAALERLRHATITRHPRLVASVSHRGGALMELLNGLAPRRTTHRIARGCEQTWPSAAAPAPDAPSHHRGLWERRGHPTACRPFGRSSTPQDQTERVPCCAGHGTRRDRIELESDAAGSGRAASLRPRASGAMAAGLAKAVLCPDVSQPVTRGLLMRSAACACSPVGVSSPCLRLRPGLSRQQRARTSTRVPEAVRNRNPAPAVSRSSPRDRRDGHRRFRGASARPPPTPRSRRRAASGDAVTFDTNGRAIEYEISITSRCASAGCAATDPVEQRRTCSGELSAEISYTGYSTREPAIEVARGFRRDHVQGPAEDSRRDSGLFCRGTALVGGLWARGGLR